MFLNPFNTEEAKTSNNVRRKACPVKQPFFGLLPLGPRPRFQGSEVRIAGAGLAG
jgi:hypothetical protein